VLAAVCGPLPPRAALTLHKTLHFFLCLTHPRPVTVPPLISGPPRVTLDNLVLTHRIRGTASILQPYLIAGTDHQRDPVPDCRIPQSPDTPPDDALIGATSPVPSPERKHPGPCACLRIFSGVAWERDSSRPLPSCLSPARAVQVVAALDIRIAPLLLLLPRPQHRGRRPLLSG
jgi:hypothetical protein